MGILRQQTLDAIRREVYGSNASLRLFDTQFHDGQTEEFEIVTLLSGWLPWRKKRGQGDLPNDAITILVVRSAAIDVCRLKQSGYADVTLHGRTRRYRTPEITETQELGAGWALHCEPAEGVV